jgi:hypothetical protein
MLKNNIYDDYTMKNPDIWKVAHAFEYIVVADLLPKVPNLPHTITLASTYYLPFYPDSAFIVWSKQLGMWQDIDSVFEQFTVDFGDLSSLRRNNHS